MSKEAMKLALEELVDKCIATYALHGTSDVMIVDDGKARNKLLSAIEEALTEQESKKCGLCGEDRAFTGNCGGGRDKPNALCYEGKQTLVKEGWKLVPIEPTQEMLDAWQKTFGSIKDAYKEMLATAQEPPSSSNVKHENLL